MIDDLHSINNFVHFHLRTLSLSLARCCMPRNRQSCENVSQKGRRWLAPCASSAIVQLIRIVEDKMKSYTEMEYTQGIIEDVGLDDVDLDRSIIIVLLLNSCTRLQH
jgi:hypothetical protein